MKLIRTFDPACITVEDPFLLNASQREITYLLSLDSDRLLSSFRRNAGLATNVPPYSGWENSLIGGHTMGHYLSALAQAISGSFAGDRREELKNRLNLLVKELALCQEHSQGKEGFLWGGLALDENVEFQFDNVEADRTDIRTEAWVPWYTMHKILAGLIDAYTLGGNKTAKKVAIGLGKWAYRRVKDLSDIKRSRILSVEYGGMNDALYRLYEITKDTDFAVAAHFFDEEILINKILDGGTDYLDHLHANTTIPKIIGILQRYRLFEGKRIGGRGKRIEAIDCLDAAKAFWEMVVRHHTYVTGGNSEWEAFGLDDVLDAERTNCNCETCNTYNMLKLSELLFSINGNKKYLDYYENAYYNAILSSQNPETGMTTYFQPMATGYFKVFSTPYDKFWCCTGSGMESMTKLGNNIYYHLNDCLIVALYISSSVTWKEAGVCLTQKADLEHSDRVLFNLKGNCKIGLRVPDWARSYSVKVNGEETSYRYECGILMLDGKDGDEIELTVEKTIKAYTLPDDPDVYAFRYGPFVLSADLGEDEMRTTTTGVDVTIPAEKAAGEECIVLDRECESVEAFMSDPAKYIKNNKDGTFTLTKATPSLTYRLHYKQYQHRYGIYYYFFAEGKKVDKRVGKRTVIDTVRPGYGQYEGDVFHDMRAEATESGTADFTFRSAKEGGRFCYRMSVAKGKKNVLVFYLCKEDNGKSLCVTASGHVVFSKVLDYDGNQNHYEVAVEIPEVALDAVEPVRRQGEVRLMIQICFSGVDYAKSARVCDYIYMTNE